MSNEVQKFKVEDLHKSLHDLLLNTSGEKITGKMVIDAANALIIMTQATENASRFKEENEALRAQIESQNVTLKAQEEEIKALKASK